MTDKADHIAWAADAVPVFQRHCRTGDEHAVADLICDLGQSMKKLKSTGRGAARPHNFGTCGAWK